MYVSSSPPFRTGLAAFTASGSAPLIVLHGVTMKRRSPFLQFHRCPPVYSLRVHWVPLFPSSQSTRGLRRQSSSCCAQLSRAQTTMPHPTLPWSIELSSGVSPSLLPHCSSHLQRNLPCSAWKTQAERYRWRVPLLAPSALCGSPGFAQRVGQVGLCDHDNRSIRLAVVLTLTARM